MFDTERFCDKINAGKARIDRKSGNISLKKRSLIGTVTNLNERYNR